MTLKYFKIFAAGLSLLLWSGTVHAQATLSRLEEDLTRGGGIYHSYEFTEIEDTKAPKGYKPFYISHYGRHGSRYHYTYDYLGSLDKSLHHADSLNNLTPDGKLLLAQVDSILAEHKDMLGNLTYKGQREIKMLSRRMSERFPKVFSSKERNLIDAYSSIVRRCVVSMAVSASELLRCNPTLDVNFSSDDITYREFMNLGHHNNEARKYYRPLMFDELKKIDWSGVTTKIFKNPSIAAGESFNHAEDLWNYWAICQCMGTVNIDILKYFTMDQLLRHWQIQSGYWYLMNLCTDVFGDRNIHGVSGLIRDFVTKADAAIAGNNVAATLRYGHDSTLLPFAVALGLKDFSRIHSVDNLPIDYWDNASMIGMCSNVQIVFYKNKKNDILVKFLYNEKETTVPALEPEYGGVYYSWAKLREYYLNRIR